MNPENKVMMSGMSDPQSNANENHSKDTQESAYSYEL